MQSIGTLANKRLFIDQNPLFTAEIVFRVTVF